MNDLPPSDYQIEMMKKLSDELIDMRNALTKLSLVLSDCKFESETQERSKVSSFVDSAIQRIKG